MLKHLGPGAKRTLLRIYNQSWSTGTVPTIWKEVVIRPIPKKGKDKRDPSSYRPISLLSCVGKLLERIINKRLIWHLESNSVLASTQTGYRQFRSTEDQLALLTQGIIENLQGPVNININQVHGKVSFLLTIIRSYCICEVLSILCFPFSFFQCTRSGSH